MPYKKSICGIYSIVNILNGKFYIGSSKNIKKRFNDHLRELRTNSHCNARLQNDFNKYGEKCFHFIVLETVDENRLFEVEQEYIDKLKPYDRKIGYNLSKIANGSFLPGELNGMFGKTHSKETKERLKKLHSGGNSARSKNVYQYDLTGRLVGKYGSAREAARKNGIEHTQVIQCCRGKIRKTNNFIFSYSLLTENEIMSRLKAINEPVKIENPNAIKIVQLDKNNKVIKTYKSIYEASKTQNIDLSSIAKCCRGKYKSAGGFRWMYAHEYQRIKDAQ